MLQAALSKLLTFGLIGACIVTAVGGTMLLARDYAQPASSITHRAAAMPDAAARAARTTLSSIWHGVLEGEPQAITFLGLILLVFTPVARVVLSLVLFAIERDWMYTLITAVVLAMLGFSLASGVG